MDVNLNDIETSLAAAEEAIEAGRGLTGTGFWRTVGTIKGDPELIEQYAERVASIDSGAFRRWALVVVPLWLGTSSMVIGLVLGLVLVGFAYGLDGTPAVVVFYIGLGALLVTTHGLAHLLVGSLAGIRFTSWFIGTITRPQPGVKIDYSSYLRATPKARAWMHASGAIVTKIVPFALVGSAIAAGLPVWAVWGLVVIGVATVATDIIWSTKSSDWKKFRREMAFAQSS